MLTRSDGIGFEVYTVTASYTSWGSHSATLYPTEQGVYSLSSTINGVSTASYQVIVYCDFTTWAPPNTSVTVEMGYTETIALSPSMTIGITVPSTSCPLLISTSDGSDLLSLSSFDMSVTTVDATLVGSPRVSQVRNLSITSSDKPGSLDFTVTVDVVPSCTLSALQQITGPVDMSTPIFGNVYQDLSVPFTHEHAAIWPVDTCVIKFEIVTTGDTSYLSSNSVTSDALRTTELHLYPYIFADEGTYPTEVIASYLYYTDQVAPANTLTSSSFLVTVEPECKITSYMNDPSVSTTLEIAYTIGDPVQTYAFAIPYEPASCNYDVSYTFTIDSQIVATPSWLSIDTSSMPH